MGSLCCCPRAEDFDEYNHSHCTFLRFFFHQFFSRYGTMFHRLEGRSAFPTPPANSLAATPLSDVTENASTIPSVDADHRFSLSHRDGLVSRKFMPHFQQDSQPNLCASSLDSLGFAAKWDESKLAYGLSYVQTSSEDEDVCPTCLEEYTAENPKITTRCSHHFHLGCIYEWLERSESCPVCGKEMEFCESP